MKKTRLPGASLALLLALSASAAAYGADAAKISVAALKGPSGIGLVWLFETPPSVADGSIVVPIAVPSADLMVAKVVSGEYDVAVLPVNMAAKLYASGIGIQLAAIIGEGMVSF